MTTLVTFFFKEILALWYYSAQIIRQILSKFPRLEYLELPDFLHVPLLAKMQYFFSQCEDDTSPFAPVSFAPPQMLQTLEITYRTGGRGYDEIMAQIKFLGIRSAHYNPVLALFNRRTIFRTPGVLDLLWLNNFWRSNAPQTDVGYEVVDRLEDLVSQAFRYPGETTTSAL
jgi:hypothetical protein